jgi:malonyl-CoA decarboxylase
MMAGPVVKLGRLFGRWIKRDQRPTDEASRAARATVQLCRELLSSRGEAIGGRLATETVASYQGLDEAARHAFFDRLASDFSPEPRAVGLAGEAYQRDPSPANLLLLQQAVEAPRRELFRRMILAPGGLEGLLRMRAEMLKHPRAAWAPVANDLAYLLTNWFNRGFLVLRKIDWQTSATVLEKLITYEAVHQIVGWHDLRRRLERDRRCYGYFHPALPDEPIIFIEVALTRGMATAIQPLIDPDSPVLSPADADSAIFYSITNCQDGLRGIPFGSFLIKQVAEDLGREFPRLRRFATLSPVLGFRRWLAANAAQLERKRDHAPLAGLVQALDDPDWFRRPETEAALREDLVALCAHYLLQAKDGDQPADPVARFHLRNGARLEQINWLGNPSPTGLDRSAGVMANYVYRLQEIEGNHEIYTRDGRVIATREIESLARPAGPR